MVYFARIKQVYHCTMWYNALLVHVNVAHRAIAFGMYQYGNTTLGGIYLEGDTGVIIIVHPQFI